MKKLLVALPLLLLTGCQQHYYKLTEITTGKEFYTSGRLEGLHRPRGGGVHFQDLKTGDHVELQSVQIHEVTQREALAATGK